MHRALLASSVLLLGLGVSATARAEDDDDDDGGPGGARLSLDAEFIAPISGDQVDTGAGGGLRLGYELDLILVSLTPEIGGTAHSFQDDWEPELYRGVAGARLSFGKLVEPGIFAHVGLGDVRFRDAERRDEGRSSFTGDGGLTLDLTIIPLIDVGAHASYGFLTASGGDRTLHWVTAGGHLTLAF